ncbi:Wadjet anti-phage system protein JetD domain-containing protein [uncultured Corynebacterium sp.]|uniref:DUF3322 domain-containing protein n=1 Tax=uncultured Corynebacterium sp. TaxID=159447 RepID=UPI0026253650|nr:Wadjet anti-phage system protein JetD domain-containing protein [uncultured Corynebacterium sp.]
MRDVAWARKRALTFYNNNFQSWLAGDFSPLSLNLQPPTARDVEADSGAAFREWKTGWDTHWAEPTYVNKRLGLYGTYSVPARLDIASADMAARLAGKTTHWQRLNEIACAIACGTEIPDAIPVLARKVSSWECWSDLTVTQFNGVVRWLKTHNASAYFQRELPIPGVDTKWLEKHGGLVTALVGKRTFRPRPTMVELKSLDVNVPVLGGLFHLSMESDDLERVPAGFVRVIIVENYTTFIALPPLPNTLAVYGGGFSVTDKLGFIGPYKPVLYWSDLDSAGFAMLTRVRAHIPQVRSVLMDLDTANQHLPFAVEEPQPTAVPSRLLSPDELSTLEFLREHSGGACARIEQERIGYPWVCEHLALATENQNDQR